MMTIRYIGSNYNFVDSAEDGLRAAVVQSQSRHFLSQNCMSLKVHGFLYCRKKSKTIFSFKVKGLVFVKSNVAQFLSVNSYHNF